MNQDISEAKFMNLGNWIYPPTHMDLPTCQIEHIASYKFPGILEVPDWVNQYRLVLVVIQCENGIEVVVLE